MSNIYGDPGTGMQVTVIGGEVALGTHTGSEFEPIGPNNPLQTVSSPGTATPTSLISKISRFIGWSMFNATPSTRTEGQAGPLQSDALGNLLTSLATRLAGEDITNNVTNVAFKNNKTYISTASTTTCKAGPGLLHSIVFQGGTPGTVIGYDNGSAATGDIVFSFDAASAVGAPSFNCSFSNGLTVITSAATKLTVNAR